MLRVSPWLAFRLPKNMGVAPRHDLWREKYDAWAYLRRMGRIVGTGFYIPPEWYNHFRMFPPIQHNFLEEKTLNPHNDSEPTQSQQDHVAASRRAIRDELAKQSRSLASDGMRYFNMFWVEKSLDKAERQYYNNKRRGFNHEEAIKAALEEYYSEMATKARVHLIQSEEAKVSGNFITMREAGAVLNVLTHIQSARLAPHQYGELADSIRSTANDDRLKKATIIDTSKEPAAAPLAPPAEKDAVGGETADGSAAAALHDTLASDNTVCIEDVNADSVPRLRETATDNTGIAGWYHGASPMYPA